LSDLLFRFVPFFPPFGKKWSKIKHLGTAQFSNGFNLWRAKQEECIYKYLSLDLFEWDTDTKIITFFCSINIIFLLLLFIIEVHFIVICILTVIIVVVILVVIIALIVVVLFIVVEGIGIATKIIV